MQSIASAFACALAAVHAHPEPQPGYTGRTAPLPPFTIVAYPDTQYYSETAAWTRHFNAQTQWTKDWHTPFNIAFATHLGDIVDNGGNGGNLIEWQRADAAMDVLDTILPNGMFPYGVCLGNHDFEVVSDKNSGSAVYDQYFGPARYTGRPWYYGFSPDRQNHAQVFEAGGRQFLHLTFEWRPDLATFQWAQSVVDAHPGMPTICSTHEHVNDANTSGTGAGRSAAGNSTWLNFVRLNPQVFMFLNGHFASGVPNHNGEHAIVGINAAGREVFEMLSDYQNWTEGGSGYMRLIRLDERNGLITVRTFSPSLSLYQTDWNSQFRYNFDFENRFDGTPPRTTTLTLREGTNTYLGTQDAELNSATPDTANGSASVITVANSDGTPAGPAQALIRFDNLVGTSLNQIPPDRDVLLAKLKIAIVNSGSGFTLHDVLQDWTESSTWNALVGGLAADGTELLAAPSATAGANDAGNLLPLTTIELDVTASLRSHLNGTPNRGWAMLSFPTTNGIDFISSESGEFLNRPQLIITMPAEPVTIATFQQGVNGYAGTQDTELRQSAATTNSGASVSMFIDSSDPNGTAQARQGLLRFDALFGSGPGPASHSTACSCPGRKHPPGTRWPPESPPPMSKHIAGPNTQQETPPTRHGSSPAHSRSMSPTQSKPGNEANQTKAGPSSPARQAPMAS
ncbi:MAG: DNRLRE domain-containing protein [Planctomycetota bacterium]|nr:DNRLRE domain-containing protein [Planctomycetota bacterium]